MKSSNYNDAYYRLGITQEERKNIFNGCVNRDKIAFDNNGISQIQEVRTYQVERKKKNDLADRLIKMAICCVAIISVVVMAAYGTKNSKGHLRGVGSLFGSDDSSDYGKYTLEVITVWNDNHARPKIGEQIDMWIAKENYMTVLSKFTEGKNSLDAFRSIYKEHLGKARVVDVSENEFNPKIRNMEDKLFRNVLLYESMSEYYSNAADIPISVRGIKEEAYVKYEVTISMEKELIKKLEENEKEYGKSVYTESSLGVNVFPEIIESDVYELPSGKSVLTVAYWPGEDMKFDIKEKDAVDLIVNSKDGEEKRFENLEVREVELATDIETNALYYVSFNVSKELAQEVQKIDNEKTKRRIFSFEKK